MISKNTCRLKGPDEFSTFTIAIPDAAIDDLYKRLEATRFRTAAAWDKLMKGLGYTRYGAVGNDVGALVTRELAILRPEGLLGVHLQQIFAFPSGAEGEMDDLSPFELGGFANLEKFQKYNGYADIQSKRPGTLAFGLVDSPVAQLAWNAELAFGFEGEAATSFDRDLFLANTSLYWFTATGSG